MKSRITKFIKSAKRYISTHDFNPWHRLLAIIPPFPGTVVGWDFDGPRIIRKSKLKEFFEAVENEERTETPEYEDALDEIYVSILSDREKYEK